MAKPAQQATAPAEEEQSFPRGGASSITPLKRRQIRAEAQADAERDFFASASADDNKRRKKGRRTVAQVRRGMFAHNSSSAVTNKGDVMS